MPDVFLRSGETSPNDIRLFDPTLPSSGGIVTTLTADTVAFVLTGNAAGFKTLLLGGVGAYTETGRSAPLRAVLRPTSASYVLTGYPAAGLAITVLLDWLRIDSGDHSRFNDILTN